MGRELGKKPSREPGRKPRVVEVIKASETSKAYKI